MKKTSLLIFIFISLSITGQSVLDLDNERILLRLKKIDSLSLIYKEKSDSTLLSDMLLWDLKLLKSGIVDTALQNKIKKVKITNDKEAMLQKVYFGKFKTLENKYGEAYELYTEALNLVKKEQDSLIVCSILYDIILLTHKVEKIRHLTPELITDYKNYASNPLELYYANYLHFYEKNWKAKEVNTDSIPYEISLAKKANCNFCEIQLYQRIGANYRIYGKNLDSSIVYNKLALRLIEKENNHDIFLQMKKGLLNNLGITYFQLGNCDEALKSYEKALTITSLKNRLINDLIILKNISDAHKCIGNFDKALHYYELSNKKKNEFDENKHSIDIQEIKEKYENEKLSKEKTIARSTNFILGIIIFCLIAVSILIFRSLRRKQKLIKREKELILKNQELQSIDAMLEGQEKERQRIANELHDDLGGLLATLKLYVQNLKVKKAKLNQEHDLMINKTDSILEEAYQKVRSIAQTRNSGVLTSEGLIPTIRNYANKVSASNHLIVEVEDYGMEQRLGNSTEITIFRIVQELITNVIKHANAEKISIDITNHEESINIIVEDDGIGFDKTKVNFKNGMGLSSIMKRIKNLEGTIDIDSKPSFGTSIILNIPI